MFNFKAMADFQYLPIRRLPEEGKNIYEDLLPRLVPSDFASSLSWWDDKDDTSDALLAHTPHFLPPYIFSRWGLEEGVTHPLS